jgi:hypothetical protein
MRCLFLCFIRNPPLINKDFKKLLLILPHAKDFAKRATDARISYSQTNTVC